MFRFTSFSLLLFSLAFFGLPQVGNTQIVTVETNVYPPYPVQLDYYIENGTQTQVLLTNTTQAAVEMYFRFAFIGDNGVTIRVPEDYRPDEPFALFAGETRLLIGSDLEELLADLSLPSGLDVSGFTPEEYDEFLDNRALPEGNYRLCVSVYDYYNDLLITTDCSDPFAVTYGEAPQIYLPNNGHSVTSLQEEVLVAWYPATTGNALGSIEYELEILEVDPTYLDFGLDFIDAFFEEGSDIVYSESGLTSVAHSFWVEELSSFNSDHAYFLRVTATDPDGSIVFNNDGKSNLVAIVLNEEEAEAVDPFENLSLEIIVPEASSSPVVSSENGEDVWLYWTVSGIDADAEDKLRYKYLVVDRPKFGSNEDWNEHADLNFFQLASAYSSNTTAHSTNAGFPEVFISSYQLDPTVEYYLRVEAYDSEDTDGIMIAKDEVYFTYQETTTPENEDAGLYVNTPMFDDELLYSNPLSGQVTLDWDVSLPAIYASESIVYTYTILEKSDHPGSISWEALSEYGHTEFIESGWPLLADYEDWNLAQTQAQISTDHFIEGVEYVLRISAWIIRPDDTDFVPFHFAYDTRYFEYGGSGTPLELSFTSPETILSNQSLPDGSEPLITYELINSLTNQADTTEIGLMLFDVNDLEDISWLNEPTAQNVETALGLLMEGDPHLETTSHSIIMSPTDLYVNASYLTEGHTYMAYFYLIPSEEQGQSVSLSGDITDKVRLISIGEEFVSSSTVTFRDSVELWISDPLNQMDDVFATGGEMEISFERIDEGSFPTDELAYKLFVFDVSNMEDEIWFGQPEQISDSTWQNLMLNHQTINKSLDAGSVQAGSNTITVSTDELETGKSYMIWITSTFAAADVRQDSMVAAGLNDDNARFFTFRGEETTDYSLRILTPELEGDVVLNDDETTVILAWSFDHQTSILEEEIAFQYALLELPDNITEATWDQLEDFSFLSPGGSGFEVIQAFTGTSWQDTLCTVPAGMMEAGKNYQLFVRAVNFDPLDPTAMVFELIQDERFFVYGGQEEEFYLSITAPEDYYDLEPTLFDGSSFFFDVVGTEGVPADSVELTLQLFDIAAIFDSSWMTNPTNEQLDSFITSLDFVDRVISLNRRLDSDRFFSSSVILDTTELEMDHQYFVLFSHNVNMTEGDQLNLVLGSAPLDYTRILHFREQTDADLDYVLNIETPLMDGDILLADENEVVSIGWSFTNRTEVPADEIAFQYALLELPDTITDQTWETLDNALFSNLSATGMEVISAFTGNSLQDTFFTVPASQMEAGKGYFAIVEAVRINPSDPNAEETYLADADRYAIYGGIADPYYLTITAPESYYDVEPTLFEGSSFFFEVTGTEDVPADSVKLILQVFDITAAFDSSWMTNPTNEQLDSFIQTLDFSDKVIGLNRRLDSDRFFSNTVILDTTELQMEHQYFVLFGNNVDMTEGDQLNLVCGSDPLDYTRMVYFGEAPGIRFTSPEEENEVLAANGEGEITLSWTLEDSTRLEDHLFYDYRVVEVGHKDSSGIWEEYIIRFADTEDVLYAEDSLVMVEEKERDFAARSFVLSNDELKADYVYVLAVAAYDSTGASSSEAYFRYAIDDIAFVYGGETDSLSACEQNCYYTTTISSTGAEDASNFQQIEVGQFTMTDLNITSSSNEQISGTGKIELDFFRGAKVEVEFSNISINAEGRMMAGEVKAKNNSSFSIGNLNTYLEAGTPISEEETETVHNFLKDNNLGDALAGDDVTMPIGLDMDIKGYRFTLGFTKMTFEPTTADINLIASVFLPTMGEGNYLALGASDICVNPGGLSSEYILHLVDDLVFDQDDWAFAINGAVGVEDSIRQNATYLEVDCEGIKTFSLRGYLDLPATVVVPENEDGEIIEGELVTADFLFELSRGDTSLVTETDSSANGLQFLAHLDLENFQIAGLPGWGIEVNDAYIDLSDVANPTDMEFPSTYDEDEQDNTWQGLYLREALIKTPVGFKSEGRATAEIHDLIIDPSMSVTLALTDILPVDEGELDGWAFSIDSIYMTVAQDALQACGMSGKIGMPLMDEEGYLTYEAIISSNEDEELQYNFAIENEGTMQIPMWIAAAELYEDSYIKLQYEPETQEARLTSFLKGLITVDPEVLLSDEQQGNLPAIPTLPGASFQFKFDSKDGFSDSSFGFTSNDSDNETSYYHPHLSDWYWAGVNEREPGMLPTRGSTSSTQTSADGGQNLLSGFPISIKDVNLNTTGNEVSLEMTPSLALMGDEDGFSIEAELSINAELGTDDNGKKRFRFTGIDVDCARLDVSTGPAEMAGELCFYNERDENGVGKKGVKGGVNLIVPGPGLAVNLAAEFGTMVADPDADFGTEDNFAYWAVDGLFYTGEVGIPSPCGLLYLHGLGGGMSVNMIETGDNQMSTATIQDSEAMSADDAADAEAEVDVESSGVQREPYFGRRSLEFILVMALANQNIMNMDLGIGASWQKGEGLQSISVMGDAYFMTPLTDRNDPQLLAENELTFYLMGDGDIALTGTQNLYVDLGLIKGAYENDKMLDGGRFHWQNYGGEQGNGYWDFKMGTYDEPGKLNMQLSDVLDVQASAYLMAGHNVPTTLPPYPQKVLDLLAAGSSEDGENSASGDAVDGSESARSSDDTNQMRTGMGAALGIQAALDFELDAGIIYGDFDAIIGLDFNVSQDDARMCYNNRTGQTEAAGVNGWYGTGQVYAGLEGNVGIEIKAFGSERKISVLDLGAVFALQGGGPAPFWAEGRANLTYSVLNGLKEGHHRFAISLGDKCTPTYDDPLASVDVIGETYPADGEIGVNPYTDPVVTFNLPLDEVIYVPTENEFGETVMEQYRPYLSTVSISEDGTEWTPDEESWNTDRTELTLSFDDPFTPKTTPNAPTFDFNIEVRAEKFNTGSEVWSPLYVDGEEWIESKAISFRTGAHPDYFDDDFITRTVPINRQRFYLQDESLSGTGGLYFEQNMDAFFPASDNNGSYEYYIRFKAEDGTVNDIDVTSEVAGATGLDYIHFTVPELINESIYAVQVVKKNTSKFAGQTTSGSEVLLESYVSNDEDNDLFSNYNLYSAANSIPASKKVGRDEELLYVFYFQTSAYDLLSDKLANATLTSEDGVLYLQTDEPFDGFDIFGTTDADGAAIMPRVYLSDPFTGDYHSRIANIYLGNPALDYEDQMSSNPVIYGNKRYSHIPALELPVDDLNINWANASRTYLLNGNVFDGYRGILSQQEINSSFRNGLIEQLGGSKDKSHLSGSGLSYTDPSTFFSSLQGNESASQNGLAIYYDLHDRVEEDAQTLEDWMAGIVGTRFFYNSSLDYHYYQYFASDYPEWIDWYIDLIGRGGKLTQTHVVGGANGPGGLGGFGSSGKSGPSPGQSGSQFPTLYQLKVQADQGFNYVRWATGSSVEFEFEMD